MLSDIEVFATVAQQLSFTKAAEKLDISKSYASKVVSRLEAKLGVKLLVRTTRKISLTDAGGRFYGHCQLILTEAEVALNELSWQQTQVFGTLKLTMPSGMSTELLPPLAATLSRQYPDLQLNVLSSNEVLDLVGLGIDLAIRSGPMVSSGLIAQKIFSTKVIVCSSPAYLNKFAAPTTPYQLTEHQVCTYSRSIRGADVWDFQHQQGTIALHVNPKIKSNNTMLVKRLLLTGEFIGILPEYLLREQLASGALIAIMPEYSLGLEDIYAVYPDKKFLPKKTSIFINALKALLHELET